MFRIYGISSFLLYSLAACPMALSQCAGERGGMGGGGGAGIAGTGMAAGLSPITGGSGAASGFGFSTNPQVFALAMQQLRRQNQMLQFQLLSMQRHMASMQQQNQQLVAQLRQLESSATENLVARSDKAAVEADTGTASRLTATRQNSNNRTQ